MTLLPALPDDVLLEITSHLKLPDLSHFLIVSASPSHLPSMLADHIAVDMQLRLQSLARSLSMAHTSSCPFIAERHIFPYYDLQDMSLSALRGAASAPYPFEKSITYRQLMNQTPARLQHNEQGLIVKAVALIPGGRWLLTLSSKSYNPLSKPLYSLTIRDIKPTTDGWAAVAAQFVFPPNVVPDTPAPRVSEPSWGT